MSEADRREPPNPAVSKARGRIQREVVPRGAHAGLALRPDGFDPIAALEHQDQGRVAELLPVRYARMAADEGSFLRGAAALMAADLARQPATDLLVQLCGDAHLGNFGLSRTPESKLVFDVEDFDETLPGPFEWDVQRLAASVAVHGTARGLGARDLEGTIRLTVAQYRGSIRELASIGTLGVWRSTLDVERELASVRGGLIGVWSKEVSTLLETSRRRVPYAKLLELGASGPRFASRPPLLVPLRDLGVEDDGGPAAYRFLVDVLRIYTGSLTPARRHLLEQFTPVDAARKVVGVGSVGMRCFVVLLLGRDASDPFVLQVKEATASVLEPFLGASRSSSHGQRVVAGQELLQAAPDDLLGWLDLPEGHGVRSFYVRQLADGRAKLDLASFDGPQLRTYASWCAWALARAHARTGDRVAIASYLGKSDAFDEAVAAFALAYVKRNREDFEALHAAIKTGRISIA